MAVGIVHNTTPIVRTCTGVEYIKDSVNNELWKVISYSDGSVDMYLNTSTTNSYKVIYFPIELKASYPEIPFVQVTLNANAHETSGAAIMDTNFNNIYNGTSVVLYLKNRTSYHTVGAYFYVHGMRK